MHGPWDLTKQCNWLVVSKFLVRVRGLSPLEESLKANGFWKLTDSVMQEALGKYMVEGTDRDKWIALPSAAYRRPHGSDRGVAPSGSQGPPGGGGAGPPSASQTKEQRAFQMLEVGFTPEQVKKALGKRFPKELHLDHKELKCSFQECEGRSLGKGAAQFAMVNGLFAIRIGDMTREWNPRVDSIKKGPSILIPGRYGGVITYMLVDTGAVGIDCAPVVG